MKDIAEISRAFAELKRRYIEHNTKRFNAFNATFDQARVARNQVNAIVSEMKKNLDEYVKKHFDGLASRIAALEDMLVKECGRIPPTTAIVAQAPQDDDEKTFVSEGDDPGAEYDGKQRQLGFYVENINAGIAKLNDLDFDRVLPPIKIENDGEVCRAVDGAGQTLFDFTSSNANKKLRNASVNEVGAIVAEILPYCKAARKLIDEMKRDYIKSFNLDGLYSELNERCAEIGQQIKASFEGSKLDFFNGYFGESLAGTELGNFLDRMEIDNRMRGEIGIANSIFSPGVMSIGHARASIFTAGTSFSEYADQAPSRSRFMYLGENPEVSVEMDYSARGNLLMDVSESPYSPLTSSLVEQYIYQFLLAFGASRSHVCVVDVDRMLSLSSVKELEKSYPGILYKGFVRDDRYLEDTVRDLEQQMYDNADALEGKGSFIECLGRGRDQAPDAYLLVLVNFPAGCTPEIAKRVASIMGSGSRSGVFTLLINNRYRKLEYNLTPAEYSSFMKQAKASSLTVAKRARQSAYTFTASEDTRFIPLCAKNGVDADGLKQLLK